MTDKTLKLCDLDEIEDGDSNAFFLERNGKMESFMVIRKGQTAFVYINSCPHIGAPLDLAPGRFLTPDKSMIICSTHGALFRIEDGFCLSGPCAEKTLTQIPVRIHEGEIYLTGQ